MNEAISTVNSARNRWWSLSVASIATLIVTADTGQLSVALPVIISEFNADLTLASWIALVYALITASLYLPCGRLSDLFGVGRLFLIGFVVYASSSLAAGLAHGAGQLILFRALQAAGSALIMANNFALVTALFPPEERGRAMGIAGGTISAMGYTLGPVLGGLLTYTFGWRSNFFVSATLACVGFSAARILLPPESFAGLGTKKENFDGAGAIAFALAISLLLFGLTSAQKTGWWAPVVILSLISGSVALLFFLVWEKRVKAPLLDLTLFRIPAFTLGNTARWISFIAMSVNILLMPFFLQLVLGFDPLRAGILIAPMPFAMALLAPVTGWMSERFLPERLCALGMAVTGVAFGFLALMTIQTSIVSIVVGLFVLGFGMGLFQTPNNNLLMSSVPRARLGIGSSFLSIVRSLGYSVGAALAATIVTAQSNGSSSQFSLSDLKTHASAAAALEPFLRGFHIAYWTAAALCLAGAAISAIRVSKEAR
jgi:EmrB/QacA subfamily drug resistance transporter